jgi:hypothetical protein
MSDFCLQQAVPLPMPVHAATISYLAGIDPHLQWAARGEKGYEGDGRAALRLQARTAVEEVFAEGLRRGEADARTRGFLARAIQMYGEAIQGHNLADRYFAGKRFWFVVGPPRSGGTYVLSRLFRAHGLEMRDFHQQMVHDGIPSYANLNGSHGSISRLAAAVFEFCQFLAWAEEAFADAPVVIQKRIGYAAWIQPLESLLGGRANYVATLRHPLACAISFWELSRGGRGDREWAELTNPGGFGNHNSLNWVVQILRSRELTESEWHGLGSFDQFRLYWKALLSDLGRFGGIAGRLFPIVYGEPLPDWIAGGSAAEPARGRARDYARLARTLGLDPAAFTASIETVRRRWHAAGFEFPELPLA